MGSAGFPMSPDCGSSRSAPRRRFPRQLFGDFLAPTDNALTDALAPALAESDRYHRLGPGPLVVAEGVAGLVASPVLARARATAGPAARGGDATALGDRPTRRGVDRSRAELQSSSASWLLSVPSQELEAAELDAMVAGRRLLLVGGEAAALLVAFAVSLPRARYGATSLLPAGG